MPSYVVLCYVVHCVRLSHCTIVYYSVSEDITSYHMTIQNPCILACTELPTCHPCHDSSTGQCFDSNLSVGNTSVGYTPPDPFESSMQLPKVQIGEQFEVSVRVLDILDGMDIVL